MDNEGINRRKAEEEIIVAVFAMVHQLALPLLLMEPTLVMVPSLSLKTLPVL
jgi:hypothetical protein